MRKPITDFEAIARLDPEVWFAIYGVLKDKEGKVMEKRKPNLLQRRMFAAYREAMKAGKPFKCLGLKPRQVGLSTVIAAITYHHNRTHPNMNGALMADKVGTADKVFEIYRTFAECDTLSWGPGNGPLPAFGSPGNIADEIVLPNGSRYGKETAGSARAGAGGTIQVANGTEVAHFPVIKGKDPALGFLNSWYDEGAMSLGMFDTTPNGPTGLFYDLWQDKGNGYSRIFAAWFEFLEHSKPFASEQERQAFAGELDDDEREEIARYKVSLEQMHWRRGVIKVKCQGDVSKFRQEYPSDDTSCLTGDARIGTNLGILRMDQVEVGMISEYGRIIAKEKTGNKPVFRITTKSGYSIRATGNHRFRVGLDNWVRTDELQGLSVELQSPLTAEVEHVEKWAGFAGVEHSLRITEDWGAFLGYFMGDGSFGGEQLSMLCDVRDVDLIERIHELVELVSGRRAGQRQVGRNKGAVEIRVADKRFREVFERLGLLKEVGLQTKRKVSVPECIFRSPKPVIRQFLSYLFEADGWASKTTCIVKFFSKEPAFIADVQRLLLCFGVKSRLRHVVKRIGEAEHLGVEMVLPTVDARKFMDEIGFVSERKRAGFASTFVHKGRVLERYSFTDEVISVEPDGVADVWDIQIDGQPMFGANGLLAHNCFLLNARLRFKATTLTAMAEQWANQRPMVGELSMQDDQAVSFRPDEAGTVEVIEQPRVGCRYLVSMDTCTGKDQQASGGKADPDWHSIGVLRSAYVDANGQSHPPKIVAHHYSRLEAEYAALVAASMSIYYGRCIVVPEVNNCGIFHVKALEAMDIPVYQRTTINRTADTIDKQSGWRTDVLTRRTIIDNLGSLIADWKLEKPTFECPFPWILDQLTTFVRHKDGAIRAMSGKHDDGVMMLAIALFNEPLCELMRPVKKKRVTSEDINRREGWSSGNR